MRTDSNLADAEDVSDEQKLAAIVAEFGDIASLMERVGGASVEPERMLAESEGSLFK